MSNETIAVGIPAQIYLDLSYHLRKQGDLRKPEASLARDSLQAAIAAAMSDICAPHKEMCYSGFVGEVPVTLPHPASTRSATCVMAPGEQVERVVIPDTLVGLHDGGTAQIAWAS